MTLSFQNIVLFATLGITSGTLAGMLGIGGGMVIVPGLFYLFSLIGLPTPTLMHMASGSAMCIMIFTSAASTLSHQLNHDVEWDIFRQVIPSIGLGVLVGNLLANHLDNQWLEVIFGGFLVAIATKILLDWQPTFSDSVKPSWGLSHLVGSAIGFKSGVLGIGGGAISVPFLLYCGLPMSKASGTSASFTLPIAIVGTLSFLWFAPTFIDIPWSTGYIYWPAVALVAPFTMIGAPLGALFSRRIPATRLRHIFALLLLFIGLRMLGSSLQFL